MSSRAGRSSRSPSRSGSVAWRRTDTGSTDAPTALLLAVLLATPRPADGGVPFPLALYSPAAEDLDETARLGFTHVVAGAGSAYMRAAAGRGLRVVANTFYDGTEEGRRRVLDLRGEANVVAQVVADEPDVYGQSPAEVGRRARGYRDLDTRPVWITAWAPPNYAAYKPHADVFAVTPYPITFTGPARDLSAVFRQVVAARAAEPRDRPVWAVVQCFAGLPVWPRPPTPAELRSMAFQAVIAGADGLAYYAAASGETYPMPSGRMRWRLFEDAGLVEALRGLNAVFAELGRALAEGERPAAPVLDGGIARTTIRHDGREVLLVANATDRPGTFVARLVARRRIIYAEGAAVEGNGGTIVVRLGPWGAVAVEARPEGIEPPT